MVCVSFKDNSCWSEAECAAWEKANQERKKVLLLGNQGGGGKGEGDSDTGKGKGDQDDEITDGLVLDVPPQVRSMLKSFKNFFDGELASYTQDVYDKGFADGSSSSSSSKRKFGK